MTLDQLKEQEVRLRSLLDANLKAQQDIYRAEFSERTGINVGSVIEFEGDEYMVVELPSDPHKELLINKKYSSVRKKVCVSHLDKLTVIKP